jgi:hypothetical protein
MEHVRPLGHHQKAKSINHEDRRRRLQPKDIDNTFNKIMAENLQEREKETVIQVQEAFRTPSRQDQKINTPRHIIVKTLNIYNKGY